MIIMEGTAGAGKTSLLGALLTEHPDALIYPEAQPPPHSAHPADLEALLAEDLQRTRYGAEIAAAFPNTIIASDRCHLGVLAYRYALAATGEAPRAVFEEALEQARRLELDTHHHDDEVHLTILDPEDSRRRRERFACDDRYQRWFDAAFLAAYNDFLSNLDRWVTPGPRWSTHTAETGNAEIRPHREAGPPPVTPLLACTRGCTENRSPILSIGDIQLQLHTEALHLRTGDHAPARCLRTATEITDAWYDRTLRFRRDAQLPMSRTAARKGAPQ